MKGSPATTGRVTPRMGADVGRANCNELLCMDPESLRDPEVDDDIGELVGTVPSAAVPGRVEETEEMEPACFNEA